MIITTRHYKLVCFVSVCDVPRVGPDGPPHTLETALADIDNRTNRGDGYYLDICADGTEEPHSQTTEADEETEPLDTPLREV